MVHARLLDIAVREFGRNGPEGASTRAIAAAAGTAMSSITYHYGGKDGLYLAAAEHIAAGLAAEHLAAPAESSDAGADTPAAARAAIHALIARMVAKMAREASAETALFIVREQMSPTAAFAPLYDIAMGPMMERLVDLVCTATRVRDGRAARLVAISLMSQVIGLRAIRASSLRLLARDGFDDALLTELGGRIAANTDAVLDRLIAEHRHEEPA